LGEHSPGLPSCCGGRTARACVAVDRLDRANPITAFLLVTKRLDRVEARGFPGGRMTIAVLALLGFATTLGSMMLAFVPPPEELNPALAVLKVAGLTAVLLVGGAAVYVAGSRRAQQPARLSL